MKKLKPNWTDGIVFFGALYIGDTVVDILELILGWDLHNLGFPIGVAVLLVYYFVLRPSDN